MKVDSQGHDRVGWALSTVVAAVGWALRKAFATKTESTFTPNHSSQSVALIDSGLSKSGDGGAVANRSRYSGDATKASEQVRVGKLSALFPAGALLLGVFAGVSFLYVYWTSANNGWLGGTLALSLGLIGAGLILWSHWLVPRKQVTEPRPRLSSSPQEQQAFIQSFASGEHHIERRNLLKWMSAAIAATFAAIAVSVLRSFGRPPGPSLFNTVWTHGQRLVTVKGEPLTV